LCRWPLLLLAVLLTCWLTPLQLQQVQLLLPYVFLFQQLSVRGVSVHCSHCKRVLLLLLLLVKQVLLLLLQMLPLP
jgi:hypothetical protein